MIGKYDQHYHSLLLPGTYLWKPLGQEVKDAIPVALSGDGTILTTLPNYLRVYEYGTVTDAWEQIASSSDIRDNGGFGHFSVGASSVDGMTHAAGDYQNDYVAVFKYDDQKGGPMLLGQVLTTGRSEGNNKLGKSVALSSNGRILAAGAEKSLFVYRLVDQTKRSNPQWQQMGQTIEAFKDTSLGLSSLGTSGDGMIVAAGAPAWNNNAGCVAVFKYNKDKNRWKLMGQVLKGSKAGKQFGYQVAIADNGNVLAVGVPMPTRRNKSSDAGYVRVYKFNDDANKWERMGQDLVTEAAKVTGNPSHAPLVMSGWSMALSRDGNVVATGGTRTNRGAGVVRVYHYEFQTANDEWVQVGQDLNGKADNEQLGGSLALSADGRVVAVGAIRKSVVYSLEP